MCLITAYCPTSFIAIPSGVIKIGRGGTIVLTTHHMEEAEALCDRIAIIDHGKVIAEGRPSELIAALGNRRYDWDASKPDTGKPPVEVKELRLPVTHDRVRNIVCTPR